MKNVLKIMAAIVIIALPLVITSCKKDEDKGPKTYEYSWLLQNTQLSSPTVEEEEAALAAKKAVNALFTAEFTKRGFTVNASTQTFSIVTEEDVANWDSKVKQACYTVKGMAELATAAEALPAKASIVVKRSGSKEVTIFNETLK